MAWISTVSDSGHFDYLYTHFYQLNIEDFVVAIHHGDFLYFPTLLVNSKNTAFNDTPCCSAKSLILVCAYVEFFPVLLLISTNYKFFLM